MRSFEDDDQRVWEVTVGRESWGTFMLLFAPREGSQVRKTILASETALGAERELSALTDEELRARLKAAQPWE